MGEWRGEQSKLRVSFADGPYAHLCARHCLRAGGAKKKNESEGGPALKELAAWKETFQGTDNHRTMGAAWRVVWG